MLRTKLLSEFGDEGPRGCGCEAPTSPQKGAPPLRFHAPAPRPRTRKMGRNLGWKEKEVDGGGMRE